jgi:hypothetical protein
MVVDHDKLRLTAENMRWRDEEADRASLEGRPNTYFTSGLGSKGSCVVALCLWYTDLRRLFFSFFFHCVLRGIEHDFMLAIARAKGGTALPMRASQQRPPNHAGYNICDEVALSKDQIEEASRRLQQFSVMTLAVHLNLYPSSSQSRFFVAVC